MYGYHIIRIADKTEAKVATLEDSTAKIKKALLEEKLDTEFDPWLQERLAEYTIENYLTSPNVPDPLQVIMKVYQFFPLWVRRVF